jgi:hypothetical protein
MSWQPIETAPKVGRMIVGKYVQRGPDRRVWWSAVCWRDPFNYRKPWCIELTDQHYGVRFWTHWMPLPEPPQ